MPFGGGSRRCLGAAFAAYEFKLVVATLHAQHRLAMVDERPLGTAVRGITFGPRGAVEMRYLGRAHDPPLCDTMPWCTPGPGSGGGP